MSIKQEKITQILNMIIKESICNGELPTEKNVLNKFRTYILQHNPSKPFFNSTPAVRGSEVVYSDINSAFDNLYEDLSLLYRRCLALNRDLMSNYILVEKQKSAVDNELKRLEEEAKALIILNNSPTYLNCVYDSFVDFSKVDSAKTNADVDISKHKVSISYNKDKTKRIATQPIISVLYPDYMKPISDTVDGDIFNMFDDYENTIYSRKVVMDNNQGCIMEILYDFGDTAVSPNKIAFDISTNSPIFARVMYSPDNINIFDLPHNSDFIEISNQKVEVNFPQIQCKQIKFILMKGEPDSSYKADSGQRYVYDYSIRQLALYNLDHSDDAVLISKPLNPVKTIDGFTVGKVSISADYDRPDETDIEYYVALEPESGEEADWARLSPINDEKSLFPTYVDFMNRSTASGIIAKMSGSLAEHELTALNTNGIKMYSIHNTTDNIMQASIYKGLNSALIKTSSASPVAAIPDMSTFTEETVGYYGISNGSVMYEGMFNSPRVVQISVNFINKTANNSLLLRPNIPTSSVIYLNGRVIIRGDKILFSEAGNYNLRTGMNNLTIMSYVPADTPYSANIGLNLINTFGEVYAHDAPMTMVDIFDLQNVVLSNDHSKYSLYKNGSKTYFVVNDDNQNIQYKINYDYSSNEKTNKLMFKAVLKRRPYTNTTPVLYRYVIYCE